jgi:hypothetical protein
MSNFRELVAEAQERVGGERGGTTAIEIANNFRKETSLRNSAQASFPSLRVSASV